MCKHPRCTHSTLFASCPTPANRNVWLFGEAVQQYPTLVDVCNNLLPETVVREYSGSPSGNELAGSTGTVAGDRKRSAETNSSAAEAIVTLGTSVKKVKASEASGSGMRDHFKEVMTPVVEAYRQEPRGVEVVARGSSAISADGACVNASDRRTPQLSRDVPINSMHQWLYYARSSAMRLVLLRSCGSMLTYCLLPCVLQNSNISCSNETLHTDEHLMTY